MAKINKLMVGESLVGDGNEVAHIDLIIGPRGSAAESAFLSALHTFIDQHEAQTEGAEDAEDESGAEPTGAAASDDQ